MMERERSQVHACERTMNPVQALQGETIRARVTALQVACRMAALAFFLMFGAGVPENVTAASSNENGNMTEEEAIRLGEEFGIIVGRVDEDIQQELKMQKAEGVVVFEVIGGTQAELAGIKVRAVIKEIDKVEVRTLVDFGTALKRAMPTCNFTVGSYEPADPETQGVGGVMNFHFVGCKRD
jgi:hypothetical protein